MSFFKQVNRLFGLVYILMIVWSVLASGNYSQLIGKIIFSLIWGIPIFYPISILWIFIYTVFGRELEERGVGKTASMLLISIGLIIITSGIFMLIYMLDHYVTYSGDWQTERFIDSFMQPSNLRSWMWLIRTLVFFSLVASCIKLYDSKKKKEVNEKILDEDMINNSV